LAWALEWAWLFRAETNLRCAGISGICLPNRSIVLTLIVSEISAFIAAIDPDQEYIYFIRLETLPSARYIPPTNLVYPLTLRVTGIKTRKNAIVENLDCQTPVTQLKGPKGNRSVTQLKVPKGNGAMQAAKRD